jgi:hypothetical protein
MANIDHVMPNPVVVPIFWGHDYVANPDAAVGSGDRAFYERSRAVWSSAGFRDRACGY